MTVNNWMRSGLVLTLVVAGLAVGYLAYSAGWGPLDKPTERFSTTVRPDVDSTLAAGDAKVRVPAGAVVRSRELRVDVVDTGDEIDFATVHGRRLAIRLRGKLRRSATIEFALPSDVPPDTEFFAITRADAGARWRAVRSTRRGDRMLVRTRHFSDWRLASFRPSAITDKVRDLYRETVDSRVDRPDCDQSAGEGTVEVEPTDDPAVFACLEGSGDEYDLRLYSNRAVGMTVPIPDGWSHVYTSSPSLGEAASATLTQIGEALPGNGDGGGSVLLPATGRVTLRSSGARPAKFRVFADNGGSVIDLLLTAVAKSKDEKVRAKFAEYSKCLFEYFGGVRDRDIKREIRKIAECLDEGIPLLARVFLVGDVLQAAAANLDAIRGKADSTVRVRFGADDGEEAPQVSQPPVRRPKPPAPDPRRDEFPSCAEYNQLAGPDADAVLERLTATYGDGGGSRSLTRLSVAGFCRLNPGRSIAGVYGGGSQGVEPATSVPTCAEFLQLGDAQADAVLDLIATNNNDDSSIGTRRLSAAAFCELYPGRTVDGIYGGSG